MTDLIGNLALGMSVALSLKNLALCFLGCLIGTLVGVLPGVGPIATITMLLPITFGIDPDRRADHAGRHLLRRAVRRLDDGDPGQHPRRGHLRRHHARRPSDGQAGPRRRGARHRRHRLLHRRLRRHHHHRRAGCSADGHGLAVRPGRLFLADGAGAHVRRRAGARLGAQGDRHHPGRHFALHHRHGPGERRGAPHLRLDRDRRRPRRRRHRHGHVRFRRDPAQPRDHADPRCRACRHRPPAAQSARI